MQSADWFVSWWHSDKLRSRLQGREPRRRFASVIILPWPDSHLPFLLLLNLILLNLLLLLLLLLFHPLSSRPSHPSPHHTSWAAQSSSSLPCPYPRFEQQSSVLVLACEIWCMMIMSVVSFSLSYNETWYWMCIDANYLLVSFMIPDLYLWEVLADSHQEDRHKIGQP